jgi:vesicle coat complex subunit
MAFYDLKKEDRVILVSKMNAEILSELKAGKQKHILAYFFNEDTYIRKTAYLAIGRIYKEEEKLQKNI